MAVGRVWIHREAMDHPVFQDDWLWRLFCWCIMRASWKDGKDKRGSFTTGRFLAAELLGVSPSRVYEGLKRLEKLGCISLESNTKFTVVTVCNYDTYQSWECEEATAGQQPGNSEATAGQQQSNTDRNKSIREEGKKGRSNVRKVLVSSESFESWYQTYPRRIARGKAAEAHRRAVAAIASARGCTPQDAESWLLERTQAYAASPAGKASDQPGDMAYVPYPASWLNAGRYDDDPAEWQRCRGSSNAPTPPPMPTAKPRTEARL